jgi:hypothetical protein
MPLSDHSTAEFASTCPLDHWKAETVIFCRLATSDIHTIFDLATMLRTCPETQMQVLGEDVVQCATNTKPESLSLTHFSHNKLANLRTTRKEAVFHKKIA